MDFGRSVCYSVQIEEDELVAEANSTFYHRVCVKGGAIDSRAQSVSPALFNATKSDLH